MKTSLTLLILLTVVSLNTLAYDVSHTIFEGHTTEAWSVKFSPDGKTLISISPGEISLWDTETGRHKDIFTGHLLGLEFSPDGQTLAFANWDTKEAYLWNVETGRRKNIFTGQTWNLKFSPDGQTLAIDDALNNIIHLIDSCYRHT